jgi:hypothetical protein
MLEIRQFRRSSMLAGGCSNLALASIFCAALATGLLVAVPAGAQTTPTTVYAFPGNSGEPVSPAGTNIVQGRDGNLYTTSQYGGASTPAQVFNITPSGVPTTVYAPGGVLYGVTLGTNGNFYGGEL